MKAPRCERFALADLTDYAAGELPEAEAAVFEEHLFACAECAARAAEFDALAHAIPAAVRAAEVSGFVTDEVLNRLARDGVRMRTYTVSSGGTVRCAVWEGDEVMVLRMRGDLSGVGEVTLSQRVVGDRTELSRTTGHVTPSSRGELLYAMPAASLRQFPAMEVEVHLSTHESGGERTVGRYTLLHGGSLQRRPDA